MEKQKKADLIVDYLKQKEASKHSYTFKSQTPRFDGLTTTETKAKSKDAKIIEDLNKNFNRPSFLRETEDNVQVPILQLVQNRPGFNSQSPRFKYIIEGKSTSPGPGYYDPKNMKESSKD